MPQPTWTTPARINGLPCTNWKRRTGVTLDGTLAECIERWLSLPDHTKRDCDLGWGPDAAGNHGRMGAVAIGAYVIRNGLPPRMAADRGGQPAQEVLRRLTEMRMYDPPPSPNAIRPDSSPSRSGQG